MVDTIRTLGSLLTTQFQDAQGTGKITPQRFRDAIVSINASTGTGAPTTIMDLAHGYDIGWTYVRTDVTPKTLYVCTSNTNGAAVWKLVTAVDPAWNPADMAGSTLSNGNLTLTASGGKGYARGTTAITGKAYFELLCVSKAALNDVTYGIANASWPLSTYVGNNLGGQTSIGHADNGDTWMNAANPIGNQLPFSNGNTLGIAVDRTANLFWFRIDAGAWANSGNPVTGVGGISIAGITGSIFAAASLGTSGDAVTARFTGFAFTPPTGFSAI